MTTTKIKVDSEYLLVPFNKLVDPGDNVRTTLSDITPLAESIQQVGLLTPIDVRPMNGSGKYEIVAGFRRHAALRLLIEAKEWTGPIPVLTKVQDDDTRHVAMLVENLQRVDLNPRDEAFGFQRLAVTHGFTVQEIASAVTRPVQFVKDRLALCALPDEALVQLSAGTLSIEAGLALTKAPAALVTKLLTNPRLTPDTVKYAMNDHATKELGKAVRQLIKEADVKIDPQLSTYNTPNGLMRIGTEALTSVAQARKFLAALPITAGVTKAACSNAYQGSITVVLFNPTGITHTDEAGVTAPLLKVDHLPADVQAWFEAARPLLEAHDVALEEWKVTLEAEKVRFIASLDAKTVAAAALRSNASECIGQIRSCLGYPGGIERGARLLEELRIGLTAEQAADTELLSATILGNPKILTRCAAWNLDRRTNALNDTYATHLLNSGLVQPSLDLPEMPAVMVAALAEDDEDDYPVTQVDDLDYIASAITDHLKASS